MLGENSSSSVAPSELSALLSDSGDSGGRRTAWDVCTSKPLENLTIAQ